jgi:hypothetical protein
LGASYQFNNNFGLTGNILYISKGSRTSGTERVTGFLGHKDYTYEENFSLSYIEIPLLAKLSLGAGSFHLKGFAGPAISFSMSGKHDRVYDDTDYNEDNGFTGRDIPGLNLMEYSGILGTGIDIELSDGNIFYLELRENFSFNSFGRINNRDAFNNYFSSL